MTWSALNRRQRLFCEQYAAHGDAERAYCDAYGFPDATGRARREIGKRAAILLSRPDVRALVQRLTGSTSYAEDVNPVTDHSRATAAVGIEAVFALQAIRASDVALMSDKSLGQLEVLAHAVQQIASCEIDTRRQVLPHVAISRVKSANDSGEVKSVEDHAAALLGILQENQTSPGHLDYHAVRRVYDAMLIDLGWKAAPWARVSRALRRMTGGRKR